MAARTLSGAVPLARFLLARRARCHRRRLQDAPAHLAAACSQPHPRHRSKGSPDDRVILRCESGDDAVMTEYFEEAVLVMAGRDPYALIEEAVTAAAARSGGARPLRDKRLPPNIDVFGWCAAAGASGGPAGHAWLTLPCLHPPQPPYLCLCHPTTALLPPTHPPSQVLLGLVLLRGVGLGPVGRGAEPEQRRHAAPLGRHRRRLAVHRGGG